MELNQIETVKKEKCSIMENIKSSVEINWSERLNKDDIGEENGVKFVYLKALQRLAKEKGIRNETFTPGAAFIWNNPKDNRAFPFIQMIYSVTFTDGATFSAAADSHYYNLDHENGFDRYPTAFAANRAEARALRKALNINIVAKEELSGDAVLPDAMIGGTVKAAIQKLLKNKNKDLGEVIKEIIKDGRQVYKLDEFTAQEANAAMRYLNSIKQ